MPQSALPYLKKTFTAATYAFLAIVPTTALAADTIPDWPHNLRTVIGRLAEVEWRLRSAAGNACPAQEAAIGATFDDLSAYPKADSPLLRSSLGMSDVPQIAHVATGSPAALAGLEEGDDLTAIQGESVEEIRANAHGARLMIDRIDARIAALAAGAPAALTIRRAGKFMTLRVVPIKRCSVRFAVKTSGGLDAYSDGINIAITARMIAFTQNEDELALLAGHELGHVLGRDGKSSKLAIRRAMEHRADVLGAQLAACAGYDVPHALAFWFRLEKLSWLDDPSHGSARTRVDAMRNAPSPRACPLDGT